jgi:hypothetical protein
MPAAKDWTKAQKVFMDSMNAMAERCRVRIDALKKCDGELDCERKTMAKDVCVGEVVCPREAKAFLAVLERGSEDDSMRAYGALLKCNAKFQADGEKLFE